MTKRKYRGSHKATHEQILATIPIERIERTIYFIRGEHVILAADLAKLYGVTTKRLKEQVKRNLNPFPADFMFQLTREEAESAQSSRSQFATLKRAARHDRLMLQFATSKGGRRGRLQT